MQSISIKQIKGIKIGNAENVSAGTGCTVIISETGMCTGLDVRGGGPASRESGILNPLAAAQKIHAVLLGGGSAFGLDAAGGVMEYLEERDIGLDVGVAKVPLVCQSNIYDLAVGDAHVRPDKAMGYEACKNAYLDNYQDGNYGAGTGATVGKVMGIDHCMKSGIGSFAVQMGDLQVGAIVAVNAFGDIYDYHTGQILAGMLSKDRKSFADSRRCLYNMQHFQDETFVENTTIGVIITNAGLDKSQLCKIAGLAHNGYARSIAPVHTSKDGDSIYALSVGNVSADPDMVGTLAADVMSEAIINAVKHAKSAYGHSAWADLNFQK
ncbi:P1 family peptidase [Frisingicoccus sp.]|uniref:P1 family peptidase n=1 Tax=Frisingicoccus sp. TaxID=1918627 RepID=UPI0038677D8A